jgi:Putative viral replication protein
MFVLFAKMRVSRNYCFTFFPEDSFELTADEVALYYANNLQELFGDELFRYVIVNVEVCPTTERIHWQGYMELARPASFVAIKARVPLLDTANFSVRKGSQMEAISYCQKIETRYPGVGGFFEYGTRCPGQGHRSDLDSVTDLLRNGGTERTIAEQLPGMYLRYHSGIAAYLEVMEDTVEPEEGFVPRKWQADLIREVDCTADDRTIIWVTDVQGGRGKTRLATHLIRNYGAVQLSGQIKDMAYAYSRQRASIVLFDITRAAQECTGHLYTMAEMLKSGRLFSTKYRSKQIMFQPPHVVVFSNQTWDRSLFSNDRVKEITL